jgi:hypothetical protein
VSEFADVTDSSSEMKTIARFIMKAILIHYCRSEGFDTFLRTRRLFYTSVICDLRRGSAAARLLGSWVRIPPGTWTFVSCTVFVLSGRGLCDGLIRHPEECGVTDCDQVQL